MSASIKFSISLPQDKLNKLDIIAKSEDRSRNKLVNQAVEMFIILWLEKHPDELLEVL